MFSNTLVFKEVEIHPEMIIYLFLHLNKFIYKILVSLLFKELKKVKVGKKIGLLPQTHLVIFLSITP